MEFFTSPSAWAGLATLTLMEIILGVDNIIFISILASRLPPEQQSRARLIGLALACILRIGLIFAIDLIIGLEEPFFHLFGQGFAGRDLILLGGGIFLVYKATREIYVKVEGEEYESDSAKKVHSMGSAIIQITLLNIVFSLDSIITAVGMTTGLRDELGEAVQLEVMIVSVLLSMGFMLAVGKPVGEFVMRHPSVKMLALAFLLLIGVSLAAEAFHTAIPKAYIYSAMAFSVFVETLNLMMRRRSNRKRMPPEIKVG